MPNADRSLIVAAPTIHRRRSVAPGGSDLIGDACLPPGFWLLLRGTIVNVMACRVASA